MMPTRLMLVEDHKLLADSVTIALEHAGYVVERPPELGHDAVLDCALGFAPDVVLLDLHLVEDQTSVSLIGPLRELGAVVLMLTGDRHLRVFAECVEAGAVGLVHKSATLDELLQAVGRVANTGTALSDHERHELIQHLRTLRVDDGQRTAPFDTLSARERLVLSGLMLGLTATSIAERDCVSLATVRSQIHSVLAKLRVNSQIAAVALARSTNWSPFGAGAAGRGK